uniref:Uncharacterized protein n=1 Tax=Anguilla anguilla TaxID=7936 RepID=A0A0E9UV38_ANGAN
MTINHHCHFQALDADCISQIQLRISILSVRFVQMNNSGIEENILKM